MTCRKMLIVGTWIAVLAAAGCRLLTPSVPVGLQPMALRCEYRENPLGIDMRVPRLAWTLEAAPTARDQKQSAWQILVASTPAILATGQGDLWDSGKVVSDQQIQIAYAGKPLASRQRCYWKVRVWDRQGQASVWSLPAQWSMGLLRPDDWQGKWIAATDLMVADKTAGVAGYHALEAKSADEPKWVQVDLGAVYPLDDVTLHPPAPAGFGQLKGFGFPVRFRIEASTDPEFRQPQLIADCTSQDYPNPGNAACFFAAKEIRARYVRITATRLWNRGSGPAPFCFALAELEVHSQGLNAALRKPCLAKDSVEAAGWGLGLLTDGQRLTATAAAKNQPGHAAVLLRQEFQIDRPVSHATAFVCGLGFSELEINGRKIGDAVLDPGFTDFSRRVLYRTHDVTAALRRGPNALGVILGGGWFNLATPDLFGFEKAPWSASPRLLCQLEIEFADGTTRTVVSDGSWKWSTGAITFNGVRGGETIDARLDRPGWSQAGDDGNAWQPAVEVEPPAGKLVSQQHPPIRATAAFRPLKLTEPQPGVYVFDLGINIAGWARLATRGPRGTKVTLNYNERLNPDGTVNVQNLTSHTYGRFQTDEYILKGDGLETFEPRFTYHGFRYVQVTGLAEKPTLESLTGRWVTTDPETVGRFSCSNDRINRLQEVIRRTYLNNLHGIPTDCPQREKMGWLDDGCVGMEMAFFNVDTALFYRKWFHDMIDAQDANGHVPDIVPTCGWGRSRGPAAPGEMADPWWGGAIVMTPWKLYLQYGDARILEEGYPAMQAYVDFLGTTAKDHIVGWGLGDWLDETAGGGGRRVPVAQTSTAAYACQARIVSQAAALLGRHDEARRYAELADAVTALFNRRFLKSDTGLYAPDSQTAQALPLALGLVPEPQRSHVLARLAENITGPRQGHISSGIVGTLYVFQALMENGRDDLAYRMVTQEGYPGWLDMLNRGGTSLWEAWDGSNSQNHPTLGCIGFWFYQGLGGIRRDPSVPGFKKMVIKPAIVGDLTWVQCEYRSVYGKIASHWQRAGDKLTMAVTIPPNTTATVHVPATGAASVTESGRPVTQADGVTFLRMENGCAVLAVGSGSYHFQSVMPR